MNFLERFALVITACQHSFHASKKWPFLLRPITQSALYSTSYRLNPPQISELSRTRKLQKPLWSSTSSSWSQKVKKQAEALIDWPRPSDIPYQEKVANLVNLIGHIKQPVKFQSFQDGKFLAATFICQEYGGKPISIPVLFEGDLAHIMAHHVKKNDHVYVKGKLREDPFPFVLSENRSNFHVVVKDLNFVEDFADKAFEKNSKTNVKGGAELGNEAPESGDSMVVVRNEASGSFSGTKFGVFRTNDDSSAEGIDDNVRHFWKELAANPQEWWDIRAQSDGGKPVGPAFKNKGNGRVLFIDVSTPDWIVKKLKSVNFDKENSMASPKSVHTTKDGQPDFDYWGDLVKNPKQWLDCREKKSNGSVTPKHPDFKHKDSGMGLWLTRVPKWVLPGLENLEFGGYVPKQKIVKHSKEEVWKSLVENPSVWWDNRLRKKNEKAPDFKHKETGEALWLNSSPPDWVLSKLPPLRPKQDVGAT